ncbi:MULTISPECIES: hypothetical protein [unclassified Chryseobacterium]|uniref:hypothetical protein n=1 Tax=unclassified Chryseobacterium TaxID=2593645 RepID=UPI0028531E6A|nr:hypothetical protein [Chryseobacterium sp. CFS7]MDR4892244.1 hypothetical protein [Chryseobacterium sp. CFS7]
MKTIIFNLFLLFTLYSCSSETEYDEISPNYLITVNFKTGQVKEGNLELKQADTETTDICLKIKSGQLLPPGYSFNVLCMGGDGKGNNFIFLQISNELSTSYILMTFNEATTLVHLIQNYHQADCLNRRMLVEMNLKNKIKN